MQSIKTRDKNVLVLLVRREAVSQAFQKIYLKMVFKKVTQYAH